MDCNLEENSYETETEIDADINIISEQLNNGDHKVEVSEEDIVSVVGASQSDVGLESQTEQKQDEVFVWPWMGVIVNLPVERINGKYVGESGSKIKQEMAEKGFNPLRVRPLWNHNGHSRIAIVNFSKDWPGFHNAISFDKSFEADHLGKTDWRAKKNHGSQLYGWVARDDDYHSGGVVGEYLRRSNLKTINEIMDEDERKTSQLVSSLSNVISEKEKNINVMKCKVQETSSSLHKVMEEKEKLINIYNEEIRKMQLHTQNHLKIIFHEHEKRRLQLESQRNELEVRGRELEMREVQSESERRKLMDEKIKNSMKNESLQMAAMAQKKADENVLNLVEAQKWEKENHHKQIIELEKQLEAKQALELDIEQLKGSLKVMKHIGSDENLDVLKKMKVMTEKLEEKEEELEDLKEMQAALRAKEQKSNAELEEAREELIKNWIGNSDKARIGLKTIDHLDIKPFRNACKHKYFGKEADEKAIELCSLWNGYLRNSEWHPYKVVKVEGEDQVLVNGKDEKLKDLKNELDGDVYDAVATALLEIKDYNPRERYPMQEMWNFREGRRATVKEGVKLILNKWKKQKF